MSRARTVLWWGRFDSCYSRNRILRQAFFDLGWRVVDFIPKVSRLADWESVLRRIPRPDLVWVPCFRQRDMAAARRWSGKMGVPLVFDPLISAWDKQVFERRKFSSDSWRARALLNWEAGLFRSANLLIADTQPHADFFAETFCVPAPGIRVIPVGAEEPLFHPVPMPEIKEGLEVFFFGSFIELQAPQIIVKAARAYRGPRAIWTMLGDGPLRVECQRLAQGISNMRFEPRIAYAELPARIHRAHLLLGVFGSGDKAGRVIPNKVYQALACGRPVVTRRSGAYPVWAEAETGGLSTVQPMDPGALAGKVALLAGHPEEFPYLGEKARQTFEALGGRMVIAEKLRQALSEF